MKSILVTGGGGQLASCIKDRAKRYPELDIVFKNTKELDITNKHKIHSIFKENKFNYCINCAAYTDVGQSRKKKPRKAKAINTDGPKHLAEVCKITGTTLIHISTDFVFDGKKQTPYTEDDNTNPINVYGKTKRDGELELIKILEQYFIIRTSWLYSNYGNNFF